MACSFFSASHGSCIWQGIIGGVLTGTHFTQEIGSLGSIFYGMLGDWVSNAPLVIGSILLLIVLPILSRSKKNALLLLFVFVLPPAGLYAFCKLLKIGHFFGSKYFINFLPLFFISLFLSLKAIEARLERLPGGNRLTVLFLIFLIASNLIILPLYYRSEKQDFRGLFST